MNLRVLENFLRHLLFLLIILKGIGAIILLRMTSECHAHFRRAEFLPLIMKAPRHSVHAALYHMDLNLFVVSVAAMIVCVMGFIGAIYLHAYPIVNFTVGLNCIVLLVAEIGSAVNLSAVIGSMKRIVVRYVTGIFTRSNQLPDKTAAQYLIFATWGAQYEDDGWVANLGGTKHDHSLIDYIQTSFKCCGLWGRTFWNVRNPASCCDEKDYPPDKCSLGVAYTASCLYFYNRFDGCLGQMKITCICFGALSLAVVACSLYLSRLNALYPTQNFGSESSTETEDED